MDDKRFQNYESYFTILNIGKEAISRQWLIDLIENHEEANKHAPHAWKELIKKRRNGIISLKALRILKI